MSTIVMNTMNGAVTEYAWPVRGLHGGFGASALGVMRTGGDADETSDGLLPIQASFGTGARQWGSTKKKFVPTIYAAMMGGGIGAFTVSGMNESYRYEFPIREQGGSRCQTGRGIRESYLGVSFSNTSGSPFRIDAIEFDVAEARSRRI